MLPSIFKRKSSPLVGPDLAELQYTEVSFKSGDLALAGMLFLPQGDGPFPVVVMIHGSGTSKRNSPWYLTVAKHLAENDIAVLLPDKRGSAKSEGNWTKATFHDLAQDAISATEFIRHQTLFRYSNIGVMGFSQSGWIAPMVATESEQVAFVISMSGPGVTTDEQLLHEEVGHVADWTGRFIAKLVAPLIVKRIQQTEFWKLIGGFDPVPYWRKVAVPVFMAFGENDKNVPVGESVRRIQALDKSNMTIKVYPGGGHGIIHPATRRVQDEYLGDLVGFIGAIKIAQH